MLAEGEHLKPEYLAINPHARVPALAPTRAITENIAILNYIADRFGAAGSVPRGDASCAAKCNELLGWFASTVHISFAQVWRADRFTAMRAPTRRYDGGRKIWPSISRRSKAWPAKAGSSATGSAPADSLCADFLSLGPADRDRHGRLSAMGGAQASAVLGGAGGAAGASSAKGCKADGVPAAVARNGCGTQLAHRPDASSPGGYWPRCSAQTAPTLDARTAQAIVSGCAAHATAKQQSHAIVVVDAGGHLVAALRMDGNGRGIMDFSLAKAQAAAAWGFSTAQMERGCVVHAGVRPTHPRW